MELWKTWASVRPRRGRRVLTIWLVVAAAVLGWSAFQAPGWDVAGYRMAMRGLQHGQDPYLEAIRLQKLAYSSGPLPANIDPPFNYSYPPITFPFLRVIASLPAHVASGIYWIVYTAAVLAEIWAGLLLATAAEKRILVYVAPLAMFFPGLLADGTLLSGNVAFVLYGGLLLAAVTGWRRRRWSFFYAATLIASCVKLPFLVWLAVPVLSARKQWLQAALTALAGLSCFVAQSFLWPAIFRHYLDALHLLFSLNDDFGCGPAGLFSQWRVMHHLPYSPQATAFYLAYVIVLSGVLFYMSRKYLAGCFPLKQWAPVLLVGVALLNPRIIEYDAVPITLPLALIAWRVTASFSRAKTLAWALGLLLIAANAFGLTGWSLRKMIDGPILVLLFLAGNWHLLRFAPSTDEESVTVSDSQGFLPLLPTS